MFCRRLARPFRLELFPNRNFACDIYEAAARSRRRRQRFAVVTWIADTEVAFAKPPISIFVSAWQRLGAADKNYRVRLQSSSLICASSDTASAAQSESLC